MNGEEKQVKRLALDLIKFYQMAWSSFRGPSCRFTPTCSQYSYEAISKFGFLKGGWLTVKRLARCNPLNVGGYDPIP